MILLRVCLGLSVIGSLAGCPPPGCDFFSDKECPIETDGGSTTPPVITDVPTRVLVGAEGFEVVGTGLAGTNASATITVAGSSQIKATVTKLTNTTVRITPTLSMTQPGGSATIVISTTLGESTPMNITLVRPELKSGASTSAGTLSKPQWLSFGSKGGMTFLYSFDRTLDGVLGVPYDIQASTFGTAIRLSNMAGLVLNQPAKIDDDADTDFVTVDTMQPQQLGSCRAAMSYGAQIGPYAQPWGMDAISAMAAGSYKTNQTLIAASSATKKLFTCLVTQANPPTIRVCREEPGFATDARSLWVASLGAVGADILVQDTAGKLQLWRANGSDVFSNASSALGTATSGGAVAVATADVDGMTGTDIVALDTKGVTVLVNNGQGTQFTASVTPISAMKTARAVMVGDVDGDAKPDIVMTEAGTGKLYVLLNEMNNAAQERRWLGPAPLVDAAGMPVTIGADDVVMFDDNASKKRRIIATDVATANKKFVVWQNSFTP